jgi:hypothetical protein
MRLKNLKGARCLWVIPIFLATQEAEIRRTVVRDQPSSQDPIWKKSPH